MVTLIRSGAVALLVAAAGASSACGGSAAKAPSVATTAVPTAAKPEATASRCVSIAAWNDLHGQIEAFEVQLGHTRVPLGGIVALADRIALVRATTVDPLVLLDAGDLFTGPLASTMAEGAPIIDAYNVIGVDAVAIGNHEFDFGPVGYSRVTAPPNVGDDAGADGPRGALLARMQSAHFPFLAANIRRAGGGPLGWPNAPASIHVRRGGFDVGVVGYTTIETPATTLAPNVVGLEFAPHAAALVAERIRALRAEGAAPVVLLAHAGLDGDLPEHFDDPADTDPSGARRVGELAALLDAMPAADYPDVIVAGHRHQWMLGRIRGVPSVSSDSHGLGLARIRFCRSPSGGVPRFDRIDRFVSIPATAPASELGVAVAKTVAPWQARVNVDAEAEVATLAQPCPVDSRDGTVLAEQMARAIRENVSAAAAPPPGVPVVGIVNSGALRVPLRAGTVRYRDVFATLPFESGIAVCGTTRAGLARTLTNAINIPEAREHLTFGIAGAKVGLKRGPDNALALARLALDGDAGAKTIARDDEPVWMVVSDFVLWGGDELLAGVKCTVSATSQMRIRDAWRAILAREQSCSGRPKNVTITGP